MIKKILIDQKENVYYWSSGDLHTSLGKIKESDILQGGKIKSHLNKEFIIFDAAFSDQIEKSERGPAVILKKDIGNIVATTGISKDSRIVDVGTGGGMLALHLANISPHVTSYEKSEEFCRIAVKNAEKVNAKIIIKNKDAMEGIEEKNLDLVTIDLKEPWMLLKEMYNVLKSGGFCVAYLPHTQQVQRFCSEARENKFYVQKVSETMEREWIFEEQKSRPKNIGILHTGFLVFLRKY